MNWTVLFWWWAITSTLSIGLLIRAKLKLRVYLLIIPVAITFAWIALPLFILNFCLTWLKVRNLNNDESIVSEPELDSEEQRKPLE